jgi:flagellar basal-body rod protein FlgC
MNLFEQIRVSGGAMAAERLRAEVVAGNMANMETTRSVEGGPYRRKQVVFAAERPPFRMVLAGARAGVEGASGGVRVAGIVNDAREPIKRYEPGHPDADAEGYVSYPNIDPVEETVDLMSAVRSYELNASAVQAAKQMIQQSLQLLQ